MPIITRRDGSTVDIDEQTLQLGRGGGNALLDSIRFHEMTEDNAVQWISQNPPKFKIGDRVKVSAGNKEWQPQTVLGVALNPEGGDLESWFYLLWDDIQDCPVWIDEAFVVRGG